MGHLKTAALGAGALAGADYLTGHTVSGNIINAASPVIQNVGNHVAGLLGNVANSNFAPVIGNVNPAPLLGSASGLAMGATGLYSAYRGIQKTREHGIIRGVQEGSLAFGTISGIGAITGLMATSSLTAPLLAAGLGIYGARKTWELGSTFMQAPGENLTYAATQPFKWSAGAIKSLFKGKSA